MGHGCARYCSCMSPAYICRFWSSEHHSHYESGIPLLECFFDRNPFSTSSKIWQLWVILYIVGKVWMRRLQCCWNCRKQFSIGGEILLSRPPSGLNFDVRLPEMFP